VLEAHNLTVGYDDKSVLSEVYLTAARGQYIGIVGPNGSGKSTLVRSLSRALPPMGGTVTLDGVDVYAMAARELARRLAVVTQDSSVAFDFPVRDVVLMGRSPHLGRFAVETARDYEIANQAMDLTHTRPFADRPITSLSGGERQRCMIARALAQQPSVLLLDEPTAHLDINHQIEVLDLVRRLTGERDLATIVVMHDLNLASQYCDQLVLVSRGKVLAEGRPQDVVTEARIRVAYGTDVQVRQHPVTGRPYVTLLSKLPVQAPPTRYTTIHVICGAGTGTSLLRRLRELGFSVSVGVVNVADTDQVEAEALDLRRIEDAPFSPISEEAHRRNVELAREADVVVVTGIPIGAGNLRNLEAAVKARGFGRRVFLIDDPPIPGRDFTDGEASALQRQLVHAGAELCQDEAEALAHLEKLR